MRRTRDDLVRGWLEKARRDLATAQSQLRVAEPPADIICFHAQQAAEKYLKAYLVWRGIEFPRTHALEDLVLLAGAREPAFLPLKDEASVLTPYAVEARYPEFEVPLFKHAQEAVRIAEKIQAFVLQKLPEELKSGNR